MAEIDNRINSRILYLDSHIAVVNKNIGEICERNGKDPSLCLVENVKKEIEAIVGSSLPDLEAVHRIDQPVSGCVLLSLNKKERSSLSKDFADGKIRKKYWAIVEKSSAIVSEDLQRIEHMIRYDAKHHKATALTQDKILKPGPDWKKSLLEFKKVGEGERYIFLEIHPLTGRTHQIRAQLSALGLPIKGDLKYGAKRSDPLGGIRLHSYAIQFYHPDTGELILVQAPIVNPDSLWKAFPGVEDDQKKS